MNRTLERMHRAAIIRIITRKCSRNFLVSVHIKCLDKPAASRRNNSKDEDIQSGHNAWTQSNANVILLYKKAKLSPSLYERTFSGGTSSGRTLFQFAAIRLPLTAYYNVSLLAIQNDHSIVTSHIRSAISNIKVMINFVSLCTFIIQTTFPP